MKRASIGLITCAAIIFAGGVVFAQHGRPGGASPGMGHPGGIGVGPSSPGLETHGARGNGNAPETSTTPRSGKSVSDLLSQNTKLSSNLQGLLPAGTDLQTAAAGFKNLGQFVAAVHVSHNLGIPFDTLKAKLTGADSVSLGKAIHELDPTVNAKKETNAANKQAKQDLKTMHS
jgi:hypothetical protein